VQDAAEQVVLVNAEDEEIGAGEKHHVHRCGSLHRAFSILVFQRRALSKYHSAGLWSNTCCGHPRPGESTRSAARRRLREEMGFDCDLVEVFSFVYRAEFDNGVVEHEYDHVFLGDYDRRPSVNPTEVAEWKSVPVGALLSDMKARPDSYTYWFKAILRSWEQTATGSRLRTQSE
jgi:isopentenyl-diphosphate delta-isomerase